MANDSFIFLQPEQMQATFNNILIKQGLKDDKALQCAKIFTANSVDGVYTHGVNRFPVFVQYIKEDLINKEAEPVLQAKFGGIEQWNGNLAPGPLNAIHATEGVIRCRYNMVLDAWQWLTPITGCVVVIMAGWPPNKTRY